MTEQSNELTEQEIESLIADFKLENAKIELANTNPLTTTVIDVMKGLRAAQAENKALKERITQITAYNDEIIAHAAKSDDELKDCIDCNRVASNRILELEAENAVCIGKIEAWQNETKEWQKEYELTAKKCKKLEDEIEYLTDELSETREFYDRYMNAGKINIMDRDSKKALIIILFSAVMAISISYLIMSFIK